MRAAVLMLAAVLALAGCASTEPTELDASAADQLQTSVVEVATLAADGDVTGAIEQLDALQAVLDDAVAANDVSVERAATIQAAIDSVRADLVALIPEPEPTPTETTEPEKPGKGNQKPGKPGTGRGRQ